MYRHAIFTGDRTEVPKSLSFALTFGNLGNLIRLHAYYSVLFFSAFVQNSRTIL